MSFRPSGDDYQDNTSLPDLFDTGELPTKTFTRERLRELREREASALAETEVSSSTSTPTTRKSSGKFKTPDTTQTKRSTTMSSGSVASTTSTGAAAMATASLSAPRFSSTVSMGSFTVSVLKSKRTGPIKGLMVHSKHARTKLDENERVKLFSIATKRSTQGVYKTLPVEIRNPSQLTEFQQLDSLIKNTKEHCNIYDFSDVFNIFYPDPIANDGSLTIDPSTGTSVSRNLFTEYSSVSVLDVAKSIRWLHEYTDDSTDQFHTNLQWSYHYLKNNIENSLMDRLQSKYDSFAPIEQGGPLLYVILLQDLLFAAEKSVKGLHDQLKSYRVDKVAGENVKTVSQIVISVTRRIHHSRGGTLPTGYIDTVISIYQTSSVTAFNSQFQQIATARASEEANRRISEQTGKSAPVATYSNTFQSIQFLTNMADQFYDQYTQEGHWSKYVKTKASNSDQQAALNTTAPKCFNCGESHHLKECPKPIDEARVTRNKEAYLKAKNERRQNSRNSQNGNSSGTTTNNNKSTTTSTSGSGTSNSTSNNGDNNGRTDNRFRPPENPNETRRFIRTRKHGEQAYNWNATTNRWEMQNAPAATVTTAPAASDTKPLPSPAPSATTATSQSEAAIRAEIAEITRRVQALNTRL